MSEMKYQYDHNKTYVICELYNEEKISLTNLEQMKNKYGELLLFPIKEQTSERIVRFDISGRISFSQYIHTYMDEVDFLQLIETIAKAILVFLQSGNLLSKVCLNPKFIFLEGIEKCKFLLLPIEEQDKSIMVNELIKEFICSAHIIQNSNTGAQQFLINYLEYQSVFQLPVFIAMLENMSSRYMKNQFGPSSRHTIPNVSVQPLLYEEDYKKETRIKDRIKQQSAAIEQEPAENESATVLLKPLSSETEPLIHQQSGHRAYIKRTRTKERVEVTKPVFRIGKEAMYVDYYVEGNPAISRCHAMVIQKRNRYFVMDTNSTNHTYVDDVMLRKNEEKEVESGSKIILANEEFYFEVI